MAYPTLMPVSAFRITSISTSYMPSEADWSPRPRTAKIRRICICEAGAMGSKGVTVRVRKIKGPRGRQ